MNISCSLVNVSWLFDCCSLIYNIETIMKEQLVVSIGSYNAIVVLFQEAKLHQIPCQSVPFHCHSINSCSFLLLPWQIVEQNGKRNDRHCSNTTTLIVGPTRIHNGNGNRCHRGCVLTVADEQKYSNSITHIPSNGY